MKDLRLKFTLPFSYPMHRLIGTKFHGVLVINSKCHLSYESRGAGLLTVAMWCIDNAQKQRRVTSGKIFFAITWQSSTLQADAINFSTAPRSQIMTALHSCIRGSALPPSIRLGFIRLYGEGS